MIAGSGAAPRNLCTGEEAFRGADASRVLSWVGWGWRQCGSSRGQSKWRKKNEKVGLESVLALMALSKKSFGFSLQTKRFKMSPDLKSGKIFGLDFALLPQPNQNSLLFAFKLSDLWLI